jgi:hypothetical protein
MVGPGSEGTFTISNGHKIQRTSITRNEVRSGKQVHDREKSLVQNDECVVFSFYLAAKSLRSNYSAGLVSSARAYTTTQKSRLM